MNTQPYNKTTLGGTFPFAASSQQPLGVACNDMDWHKYFTYDASRGELIWKPRPLDEFKRRQAFLTWNTRYANTRAGSNSPCNEWGHRTVAVNTRRFLLHRIIWEMHHGPIPHKMQVDHRDGDATNNRIGNLRLATNAQNSMNSRAQSNNTSGFKGVSFHKASGRWRADIRETTQRWLGLFDTPEEAHEAYKKAAMELHGEFARLQ